MFLRNFIHRKENNGLLIEKTMVRPQSGRKVDAWKANIDKGDMDFVLGEDPFIAQLAYGVVFYGFIRFVLACIYLYIFL